MCPSENRVYYFGVKREWMLSEVSSNPGYKTLFSKIMSSVFTDNPYLLPFWGGNVRRMKNLYSGIINTTFILGLIIWYVY